MTSNQLKGDLFPIVGFIMYLNFRINYLVSGVLQNYWTWRDFLKVVQICLNADKKRF